MQVTISNSILSRYSETTIGYLLAEVQVKSEHPYVESLKKELYNRLNVQGITLENLTTHTHISEWRNVYRDCGVKPVKPSKFRSSIEALVRRIWKKL